MASSTDGDRDHLAWAIHMVPLSGLLIETLCMSSICMRWLLDTLFVLTLPIGSLVCHKSLVSTEYLVTFHISREIVISDNENSHYYHKSNQ